MEAELDSLRAENSRLEEEILSLRTQLDEAKQNASLSAECGLKLMEMNQDLEQRLEQTNQEYIEQIEVSGSHWYLWRVLPLSHLTGTQTGELHTTDEGQLPQQDCHGLPRGV